MWESVIEFGWFLLLGVVGVVLYTQLKTGNAWRYYTVNPEHKDWIPAVLIPLALAAVLSFAQSARADGVRWFEETQIAVGVERPLSTAASPQCGPEGPDDKLTSHVSVRQQLWGRGRVDVFANYLHHSCVINADRYVTDMVGVQVQWTINWQEGRK